MTMSTLNKMSFNGLYLTVILYLCRVALFCVAVHMYLSLLIDLFFLFCFLNLGVPTSLWEAGGRFLMCWDACMFFVIYIHGKNSKGNSYITFRSNSHKDGFLKTNHTAPNIT